MAGSVGYFEDIDSGEDQYYWLTRPQYIMWRNICYGKDTGDADGEIDWLINKHILMTIEEQNEDLYFIDVASIEYLQARAPLDLDRMLAALSLF